VGGVYNIAHQMCTMLFVIALAFAMAQEAAAQSLSQTTSEITRNKARQAAMTKPFWAEIRAFLDQDKADGLIPCRTLFVGSSSIRLWRSLAEDIPGRRVLQRGFGGGHLRHVIGYYEELIARHRPREIVLYAGENDIAAGRMPAVVVEDLQTLLLRKRQSLGSAPVYFIAIKPSPARWDQFARQAEVNALIKTLAQVYDDLIFIDVVPAMLEAGRPKPIFLPDKLHMNADGYALWARIIGDALLQHDAPIASYCKGKAE